MSDTESARRPARRAVQYLRMSSEHQRYSIERQTVAIAEFAQTHGFEILRSYTDHGKSGLSLRGRKALKQLLADALSPARDFDTILVLDVSRVGRFQDPDQAAHYEFICKQAGVRIEYCGEPFENDGSVTSSIVKIIKRMMAGEYSRDLSTKVSAAHLRHARQGRIQGQHTPYGIRRLLVRDDGKPIQILRPGERKVLSGSWINWVLGPENELRAIRTIFDMYGRRHIPLGQIVRHLNDTPEFRGDGWTWTAYRVRGLLQSEAYIGNYVYNRSHSRLQSRPIRNDESLWIRTAVLPPIISKSLFMKAVKRVHMRKSKSTKYTDSDLLAALRKIYRRHGRISAALIQATPGAPSTGTFWFRFGSLTEACRKIGVSLSKNFRDESGALWTDASRLECLQDLYSKHGYVSAKLIDETPGLPASSTYYNQFGSIKEACARAGVPIVADPGLRGAEGNERRPMSREVCYDGRMVWSTISNEAIVNALRSLLSQQGYLSSRTIRESPDLPSISTIAERFGTILNAYAHAGWPQSRDEIQAIHGARYRAGKAKASQQPAEAAITPIRSAAAKD